MDNYVNLSGKVIPGTKKGVQFVVIEHVVEYADNISGEQDKLPTGVYAKCKGFFRSVKNVIAVKQFVGGNWTKKIISEKNIFDIERETDFDYRNISPEAISSLLIKFPKDFPYKVGGIVGEKEDVRIILSIDYIDLLNFKITFSKVIGGDDLSIYSGKKAINSEYESIRQDIFSLYGVALLS